MSDQRQMQSQAFMMKMMMLSIPILLTTDPQQLEALTTAPESKNQNENKKKISPPKFTKQPTAHPPLPNKFPRKGNR
jgi:hypothetical protein